MTELPVPSYPSAASRAEVSGRREVARTRDLVAQVGQRQLRLSRPLLGSQARLEKEQGGTGTRHAFPVTLGALHGHRVGEGLDPNRGESRGREFAFEELGVLEVEHVGR